MVQHDRRAALGIDVRRDAAADGDAAGRHGADMAEGRAELLRVADREARGPGLQLAGIADLAAAFRVERSAFENDGACRALLERLHGLPLRVEQRHDRRIAVERVVAQELRRAFYLCTG